MVLKYSPLFRPDGLGQMRPALFAAGAPRRLGVVALLALGKAFNGSMREFVARKIRESHD